MKTTILAALCATVIFAPCSRLAAEEEKPSPAIRLLKVMEFEKTAIESASGMFEPMMQHFGQLGLPEEAMAEIRQAADRFMRSIFTDPDVVTGIAAIYEKQFTPAEIEELIGFYETQLGRKMIAAQPAIASATTELTMRITEENQAAFQAELMKIMEKYQPAPEGGE